MEARLQRVLDAHHLPCGAVIAATGDVLVRVGDFAAFESDGLVPTLLGPYGSAEATFDSVQGDERLLPRMWAQDDEFAFVDRANELVIVVFGREGGDARAQYDLSKAVRRSIAVEFTS